AATTPSVADGVHEWRSETTIPTRLAGRTATPPPANRMPRVKNPVPANTRVDPASYSTLTGRPNWARLSVGANERAAPSLSTSIVGETASLIGDSSPSRPTFP